VLVADLTGASTPSGIAGYDQQIGLITHFNSPYDCAGAEVSHSCTPKYALLRS
jgi:hypothetical protein